MTERLWAGWRMAYIRDASESEGSGCLFCHLAGRGASRESLVLETYEHGLTVLNAFPYTSGHLMVAPYAHTTSLAPSGEGAAAEILAAVERARRALESEYRPHGFNIGVNLGQAGGAGIPDHVHWHVVPRWSGDTNFMSAAADTRVIPEALSDTYDRMARALASLPAEGVRIRERGS